jgi:hypothetical protein
MCAMQNGHGMAGKLVRCATRKQLHQLRDMHLCSDVRGCGCNQKTSPGETSGNRVRGSSPRKCHALTHNESSKIIQYLTALDRRTGRLLSAATPWQNRAGENCESRSCTDMSLLSNQHCCWCTVARSTCAKNQAGAPRELQQYHAENLNPCHTQPTHAPPCKQTPCYGHNH